MNGNTVWSVIVWRHTWHVTHQCMSRVYVSDTWHVPRQKWNDSTRDATRVLYVTRVFHSFHVKSYQAVTLRTWNTTSWDTEFTQMTLRLPHHSKQFSLRRLDVTCGTLRCHGWWLKHLPIGRHVRLRIWHIRGDWRWRLLHMNRQFTIVVGWRLLHMNCQFTFVVGWRLLHMTYDLLINGMCEVCC